MLAQIVLILALLLILVGMIMVLLDAFAESFAWGLLVLLLVPIAGPVYCFVKWYKDQARNGFAMSLVGLVMVAAGIYGGGLRGLPVVGDQELVKNLPSALPSDEPLPNAEAAAQVVIEDEDQYDPILSTNKDRFSAQEIDPLAPKGDKTITGTARAKINKVPLQLADIDSSIGFNVEVRFVDGSTKRGRLIASAEDSISLEEQVGGGLVSFEHKFAKISSLSLLLDPNKPPPPPKVTTQDKVLEADASIETTAAKIPVVLEQHPSVTTPQPSEQQATSELDSKTQAE